MNETNNPFMGPHDVPVDVFSKARSLDEVLRQYMGMVERAKKVSLAQGKTGDEVIADGMLGATYRLYLLGVEDGMK